MTCDMWQVTGDSWKVTHGGGWTCSLAITAWELWFVLNMTGFVLNKTGFVLIINGFVLNMTGFVLTMTGVVLNMTGFVQVWLDLS